MIAANRKTFSLLLVALILSVAPFFGTQWISFSELLNQTSLDYQILWTLRIPRILFIFSVGGSLAILGAAYQTLFRNPLAEPYVLGISSAVALGAVCGQVFFGFAPLSFAAGSIGFLFGLILSLTLMSMVYLFQSARMDRLILFGMGANFVFSSLLFLVITYHQQRLGGSSFQWLFGQIPWVTKETALLYFLISLVLLASLIGFARNLDALSLGDSICRTLGVSPNRTRGWTLLLSSFFISLLVTMTGSIGFVGLVTPHAVRLVLRPSSSRELFGVSFLLGASFLVCSDVFSRLLLPPFEFPIGIFTTLIGGPLFLYLLVKQK